MRERKCVFTEGRHEVRPVVGNATHVTAEKPGSMLRICPH